MPRSWAALVLVCALAGACTNPADWSPQARVGCVQWREIDRDGVRGGLAVFLVTNSGRVPLSGLSLAVTIRTDAEVYLLQTDAILALEPGASAYHSIEVRYRTPAERGSLEAVSIDSVSCR